MFRELKIRKVVGPPVCPKDGTPMVAMSTPIGAVDEKYPPAICWFCATCKALWTDEEKTGENRA